MYFGLISPEDFSPTRRRRAKRFQLIEHVRVELASEARCFLCFTSAFLGPTTSSGVLSWIRSERRHRSLYARILERFRSTDGFASIPRDWSKTINVRLRDEIMEQIGFSRIQADHFVPVRLLELLEGIAGEDDADQTASLASIKYAGRNLGIPLCESCKRGRHLAPLELPEYLMERWVRYYFNGNFTAAKADPRWQRIETLVNDAYALDMSFRKIGNSS